jgi:hypothetical protein
MVNSKNGGFPFKGATPLADVNGLYMKEGVSIQYWQPKAGLKNNGIKWETLKPKDMGKITTVETRTFFGFDTGIVIRKTEVKVIVYSVETQGGKAITLWKVADPKSPDSFNCHALSFGAKDQKEGPYWLNSTSDVKTLLDEGYVQLTGADVSKLKSGDTLISVQNGQIIHSAVINGTPVFKTKGSK